MVTTQDLNLIERAQMLAAGHKSGGSYNMVALHTKGSNFVWGKNKLTRNARHLHKGYPEICGLHAELDLWRVARSHGLTLQGGTIYIGGTRNRSGKRMTTTRPCEYCAALLVESRVRSAVFLQDGEIMKQMVIEL